MINLKNVHFMVPLKSCHVTQAECGKKENDVVRFAFQEGDFWSAGQGGGPGRQGQGCSEGAALRSGQGSWMEVV